MYGINFFFLIWNNKIKICYIKWFWIYIKKKKTNGWHWKWIYRWTEHSIIAKYELISTLYSSRKLFVIFYFQEKNNKKDWVSITTMRQKTHWHAKIVKITLLKGISFISYFKFILYVYVYCVCLIDLTIN